MSRGLHSLVRGRSGQDHKSETTISTTLERENKEMVLYENETMFLKVDREISTNDTVDGAATNGMALAEGKVVSNHFNKKTYIHTIPRKHLFDSTADGVVLVPDNAFTGLALSTGDIYKTPRAMLF